MALPKNRKKKQLRVRLLPVPLTIAVMALSSYALGWIWLECRCEALGRDIKRLETDRTALDRKCQIEQFQWARLKSPRNLEDELERRGIEMGWPRKDQVVRVSKEVIAAEIAEMKSPHSGVNGAHNGGVATYAKATTRE